jgi:hypothetical protein
MQNTEYYNDRVVRQFVLGAALWGIIGMAVGVYAAAELIWPGLSFDSPWLTFSRIRPDHTFGVIFGFGGSALMGTWGADVSAALGSGTELAQAHADLLLLDGRLDGLVQARSIARQVAHVVAQSRRWSLVYNLCAVPFAAFGFVPPWLAAIGMSLSSLAVVLNALRVGRAGVDASLAMHA